MTKLSIPSRENSTNCQGGPLRSLPRFLIELARDGDAEAMVLCQTSMPYNLESAQVLHWATGLNAIFNVGAANLSPVEK